MTSPCDVILSPFKLVTQKVFQYRGIWGIDSGPTLDGLTTWASGRWPIELSPTTPAKDLERPRGT